MNLWGVTDIGAVRNDTQDSYRMERLDEHTALAVVCDGMGGARAGNVASSTAVERFTQTLIEQHPQADGWAGALRHAVARANEEVYSISQDRPECRGMGTTLVAALATEETLWVVNIGDSRCYQVLDGAIRRVTRDHSLVENLVEQGEITREQARVHPQKNLITRALGVDRTVQEDLFELNNMGGYLLLCSDGLSNIVTDEELRREVVAEDKAGCCQRLLRLALERGAPDNVTAVLVQL